LDYLKNNYLSLNPEFDEERFNQLYSQVTTLLTDKTNKEKRIRKLNHINNHIKEIQKDLIEKSNNAKKDNKQLKESFEKEQSRNKTLNNQAQYDITLKDKLLEKEANIKGQYETLNNQLKQLYQDKQYYIQLINNLDILADIINSNNIQQINPSSLQADIKLSPAYKLIKQSKLMDRQYYISNYIKKADNDEYTNQDYEEYIDTFDEIEHYLLIGAKHKYNPNRNFDANWYVNYYNIPNQTNPLVDYILNKNKRTTQPPATKHDDKIYNSQEYHIISESGLFDSAWYRDEYGLDEDTNPIIHYITTGYKLDYRPYDEFDTEYYRKQYHPQEENLLLDYIFNIQTHNDHKDNPYNKPLMVDIQDTYPYIFIEEYNLLDKKEYNNHQDKGIYTDEIANYIEVGYKNDYYLNDEFDKQSYQKDDENIYEDALFNYIVKVATKNYKYDDYDYNKPLNNDITDSIEYNVIKEEGLFDEEYYRNNYPEVKEEDLLADYMINGIKHNRNPSKTFNTKEYMNTHKDIQTNPLFNHILNGKRELLLDKEFSHDINDTQEYQIIAESGLFDEEYYTSQLDEKIINPIGHFISKGATLKINPNKNFDIAYYTTSKPMLKESNINPLVYYIIKGQYENDTPHDTLIDKNTVLDRQYNDNYTVLSNSKYFDSTYYTEHNPNIDNDDDAIDYYLRKGRYEDYPTSKFFDKKSYFQLNLDLKTYGVDPVIHYTMNGHREHRPFKRPKLELQDILVYPEDIRKYYDVIYESKYFDEYYYMENYPEVEDNDMDPILHYILVGANIGYNPSQFFSTEDYQNAYQDVKKNNINPLYHYLQYGIKEGRKSFIVQDEFNTNYDSRYDLLQSKELFQSLQRKYTIIIPIYNAYEQTKECIKSLLENTTLDYELILINDCSTDERINELLDLLEDIDNIKVIHNKTNQGFVKNVNMGISLSKHDVILLNSDTIVTPKWLSKMVISAYSNPKIATVTPISNASDLSVEILGSDKTQHALNDMAYQTDKLSNKYLKCPTGNGFCLFIKREAINDIGLFDEVFGRGYGEETDFTQRAIRNGWINIRNPSVFIYHRRHASFKKENTDKLKIKNKKIIRQRYPDVYNQWDNFIESVEVQKTLDNIKYNVKKGQNSQRILCIADTFDLKQDFDHLMYLRLSRKYDTYILSVEKDSIKFYKYTPELSILLNQWNTDYSWDEDKFFKLYFNLLVNLKIDLLYVKQSRRLYHPTNRLATSYTNIIKYLEIDMIHEKKLSVENVFDITDKRLNPIKRFDELIEYKKSHIDFSKHKCVVYTAVTGVYDEPIIPSYVNEDFDYICFTDNPHLKSDFWQIKHIKDSKYDPVRTARMYKILPHKYLSEYEYSLWIDTNFEITGDITDYVNRYSKDKRILAITHEKRDCIYDEAEECIKYKKDNEDTIIRQVKRYQKEGYPSHNGLIASGILFRQHNDSQVIKLMEDWFEELVNGSYRDQLSFNYVCWKNNYKIEESPVFYEKNVYFQRHDHLNAGYFTRKINTPYDSYYHLKYDTQTVNNILKSFKDKVSIVIPIYNAYNQTKQCIESVLENTTIDYELLLINDCSSDERIKTLLDKYEDHDNITVVHNKTNQGFVKNVNKAFTLTSNDVVLLNSDTIVTPKWIQKLKIKAYTHETIASVTPVSNAAGAFSVPKAGINDVEADKIDDVANIVEKASDDSFILTPTANGFCMYIKRKAIYDVGFFDEIFGKGYGEENDFCMRLNKKGYHHIIDPSTYIYHERSASFSKQKDKLIKENRVILANKHPEYKQLVNEFVDSSHFKNTRIRIDDALKSTNPKNNRKRILYAIHDGSGGTLHTSIELMKNIDKTMDAYLLITGRQNISLYKYNSLGNNIAEHKDGDKEFVKYLQLIRRWPKEYIYSALNTSIEELKMICFNMLVTLNIDIVHIRHLIYSSFDLAEVAKRLGIPVILSFHDFYYVCPSHNLLDDNINYCAGVCSEYNPENNRQGQCQITAGLNIPIAKSIISAWRNNVEKLLDNCDAYVTTCQSAYDIYTKYYPKLIERDFNIIEHGRDIKTPDTTEYVSPIKSDEKIRIVFPGHLNSSKGYDLIKAIKEYDTDNRLEYHYMGSILGSEDLEDIGEYHGFYDRSEFEDIVHSIKPHFIAILSIWPETYCHTLTEGWASGIPVLTTRLGALKERVETNGGGFFVDLNPQKAYEEIIRISENPDEYMKKASQIPDITFKTSQSMGEDYLRLYKKYLK